MKKFFIVLGPIFLIVMVLGGIGITFAAIRGNALDKESKVYADAAIPAIVTTWADYHIINLMLLAAGGVILPVAFAVHVFLSRSRVYATWAKLAAIIFCLIGVAWGILDWVLLNWGSFRLTREVYNKLDGIRGLLDGVCIGIVLTISLARPYRKNVDKPEQTQSSRG